MLVQLSMCIDMPIWPIVLLSLLSYFMLVNLETLWFCAHFFDLKTPVLDAKHLKTSEGHVVVYLSHCVSVCLSTCRTVCLCLSNCPTVCLCVHLLVPLCVSLFV